MIVFIGKRNLGAGKIRIQSSIVFCVDVHFEAKPSEVVGKEGDTSFDFSPRFQNKIAIVYIDHGE